MIRIERPPIEAILGAETRAALEKREAGAKLLPAGSKKITSRWDSFRQGKGNDRLVGPPVCAAVLAFCREKCAFCEAPSPATIDHFWPKMAYPPRMFCWTNLLAACRDCNAEKRAQFLIDQAGDALLLDPTQDEPLKHFRWDRLTGKCLFQESDSRAVATAACVALDRFCRERLDKLERVRFFFARCVREEPIPEDLCDRIRAELEPRTPHLCILRSYFLYPPTPRERALVSAAVLALPAIVEWVRPWLLPPTDVRWPY